MGSRGISAISNAEAKLFDRIPDKSAYAPLELPEIKGVSEKQIKYGEDMRNSIIKYLLGYAKRITVKKDFPFLSDHWRKITIEEIDTAEKGRIKQAILTSTSGTKQADDRQRLINRKIDSYIEYAERLSRVRDIAKNAQAKFWINESKNVFHQELREYIDGIRKKL